MDEMDHFQEAALAAQEAMLAERSRIAQMNARAVPPAARDCSCCGDPIPAARLRALPLVRTCVDCAAAAESPRR